MLTSRPFRFALAVGSLLAFAAPLVAAAKPAARRAQAASVAVSIEAAVEREVASARKVARALGVHVLEIENDRTVYAYDAEAPRMLASNTKLLTTAAALDAFGPGAVFETRVSTRGSVVDGILVGDLAVEGSGDPNISGRFHDGDPYAVFRGWAAALKERGIVRVAGELLLSNGLYTDSRVHPEWPPDQRATWYEAPVDALSFNDNCVLVRVTPGKAAGDPARVETVPRLSLFAVRNSARTVETPGLRRIAIGREAESDTLIVSGSIGLRAGSAEDWVAVYDPAAYFGAALRAALAESGVTIAGGTRFVHGLPEGSWQLAAVLRSELASTIEVTNKRSQNFYAETLVKTLGRRLLGEGTWASGTRAVADFLAGIGVDRESFALADGSGLARGNRMSARAMTRLLDHMFLHAHSRDFVLSLPYSGERGLAWRHRLAAAPYRGNVFAKTGTIRGVSTLSGYAKAKSGKLYAFAILCNEVRSTSAAMAAQDRIVRAIIDRG